MTAASRSRGLAVMLVAAGLAAMTLRAATRELEQGGPKRPRITGVAAFAAKVSSIDEARVFYSTVLGLEQAFTIKNPVGGPDLTAFKINDRQYVYVGQYLIETNDSRLLFVGFETDDARALAKYLDAKGIRVPTTLMPDAEGNLSFIVKDPEDNAVQFIQFQSRSVHGRNRGKFISQRRLSDHALHVGYRIRDPEALDRFYKDLLGYRLIWKGGSRDDRFDWISMAVPDGNQWIEYMVNTGTPTPRQLGVLNHLALGTLDIDGVHKQVVDRGYADKAVPAIGRDGRWLMHLYDKNFTRTEFMVRKPVKEPCCSPITDVIR